MARFDAATGRYIYLAIDGVEYRVYFEEAAAGICSCFSTPRVLDCRQWRHLLEDTDIGRHFRMIAPDLPYHAKSVPPESVEWWTEEYRLTRDFFMKVPVTLAAELALDRPVSWAARSAATWRRISPATIPAYSARPSASKEP